MRLRRRFEPLRESVDDDDCRTPAFLFCVDCEISAILNIAMQRKNQLALQYAGGRWQKSGLRK
jgi:hypothetical protein